MRASLFSTGMALLTITAAATVAAKSHRPVACITWLAIPSVPVSPALGMQTQTYGFNASDAAKLDEAIAATKTVVTHPTFVNRLAAVSNLYNHVEPTLTLLGGAPFLSAYEANRVCVNYVKDSPLKNETGHTGFPPAPCAVTHLKASVVERWHGTDPAGMVSRACVINTIAHEWTHTLAQTDGHEMVTDDGHEDSPYPLVSYTVGAVAQCAFLLDYGLLTPGHFEACVDGAGSRDFYENTCTLTWLNSIENGTSHANCSPDAGP